MCEPSKLYRQTVETPAGCYEWTGTRNSNGYGRVGGKYIHRRVMEELVGPLPTKIEVLHHCDNPPCIRREHLFLGVQADNVRDMWEKRRGRSGQVKGSQVGTHILTEDQVRTIRQLLAAGASSYVLGAQFGVSKTTILHIKTRRSWRHVA